MPKCTAALPAAAIILVGMQITAYASETKPNLGRLMWSAFECATYAELAGTKELAGNKNEQARLFQLGYSAGEKFLAGIKNGTITKTETADAPWAVVMLLGGPTSDFMIGRIYQSASDDAFEAVVEKDDNGEVLAPSKWVTDPNTKASIAWGKYNRSNCALIQQPGK